MIHPLSVFPELFTYAQLAPLFLRVIIGIIFIDLGVLMLKAEKKSWVMLFQTIKVKPAKFFAQAIAYLEIIGGIALIIGLYTQVAALIFAIFTFAEGYLELRDSVIIKRSIVFYTLIFVICISLILLGPGAFALDLPL
jgi:putative oxidoreductase